MKPWFVASLIGLAVGVIVMRNRRKKTVMEKVQGRAEDALSDLESRISDLRDEAKRFSGEAKQKLQDQAHDLEQQQRELKKRFNDLSADAHKLLEKARSRVHAQTA